MNTGEVTNKCLEARPLLFDIGETVITDTGRVDVISAICVTTRQNSYRLRNNQVFGKMWPESKLKKYNVEELT